MALFRCGTSGGGSSTLKDVIKENALVGTTSFSAYGGKLAFDATENKIAVDTTNKIVYLYLTFTVSATTTPNLTIASATFSTTYVPDTIKTLFVERTQSVSGSVAMSYAPFEIIPSSGTVYLNTGATKITAGEKYTVYAAWMYY